MRKTLAGIYVSSIALCQSEIWRIGILDKTNIELFEMWCYRKIGGKNSHLGNTSTFRRGKKLWKRLVYKTNQLIGYNLRHSGVNR